MLLSKRKRKSFAATMLSVSFAGASVSWAAGINANKVQTRSKGFSLGFLPISYNYTRYWTDETSNIKTHGALYMREADEEPSGMIMAPAFHNHSYDVYHLPDDPKFNNIVDNPDTRRVPGGSFPDNDVYQVTGQGIGGVFRPYAFQEKLYIQATVSENLSQKHGTYYFQAAQNAARSIKENFPFGTAGKPTSQIHYRFVNDFSNSYRQAVPDFYKDANNIYYYNFSAPIWGDNDGNYGFNPTLNKLAGSRNIEYFTNKQINSSNQDAKTKGFINIAPAAAKGFNRESNDLTGGFSVTNESGVTYHYALPAYSFDEVMYSENMPSERPTKGHIWNKVSKPGKYAYTWFLTSITGPDFVDRNNDGFANDGDWGYWINFDYGKWADSYGWRNPSEDFHRDLDTKFQDYSKGKKEVYYLNSIRTRSHTAILRKASDFLQQQNK